MRNRYKTITVNGVEMYEHRYVMEQMLGRPLLDTEIVHHKDRNRANNNPDNLMLFPNQAEHLEQHVKEDCERAGFDPQYYRWCSYHQRYELKEGFGKHTARCLEGTNEFRRQKQYKTEFDWRAAMNQQFRRAVKKGIVSPLKEGRCL